MSIGTLRTNTLNAATAAKDAGLIDQAQFARMTDGTVSLNDVRTARELATNHAGEEKGDLASNLYNAIAAQNNAQGVLTNIAEAVRDRNARKP
ncbi:MAG: hypothetical protein HY904_25055 [Deltaproteobacteria bacterium]|nr:hypothetical protein [Deltaproteobacteria bacterium]